jgi:hypothetical protein
MMRNPFTKRALTGFGLIAFVGATTLSSCTGGSDGGGTQVVCQPGESRSCTLASGCAAEEHCNESGTAYGSCACVDSIPDGGGSKPATDGGGAGAGGGNGDGDASVDGGPQSCSDVCDPEAPAICSDAVLQSCWLSPIDGCANALTSQCQRKKCGDENHCAECVDECASSGAVGCQHGALGTCMRDAEGCLKWQRQEECTSGFCADAMTCGTCVHECATLGEVSCQDGLTRVCSADPYGCRRYSEWSECPVLQCASSSKCLAGYTLGQRGTPLDDEALAVHVDERGVAAIVGAYHQLGLFDYNADSDAYLQARTIEGSLVKDTKWGSKADDSALAVAVDSALNHLVVGWTAGKMDLNPHRGGRDAFIAKWGDDPAKPIWIRQWGSSGNDVARALAIDAADGILVVGSTNGKLGADAALGMEDLFVTKWDSSGNRLWTKQWGSESPDVATAAALDKAGHLWIVGRTAGDLGTGNLGDYDAFLTELDPDGTPLFTKQFGSVLGDSAEGIAIDADGNIFVTGFTQGAFDGTESTGGIDTFVTKLTSAGAPIWTRLWGTTADDFAEGLALDRAGNPYVAVSSLGTAGPSCPPGQAWVAGWDANGGSTLQQAWDSCGVDTARGIATQLDGEVLVVGSTTGELAHESRGGKDIISITLQPN